MAEIWLTFLNLANRQLYFDPPLKPAASDKKSNYAHDLWPLMSSSGATVRRVFFLCQNTALEMKMGTDRGHTGAHTKGVAFLIKWTKMRERENEHQRLFVTQEKIRSLGFVCFCVVLVRATINVNLIKKFQEKSCQEAVISRPRHGFN